MTISRMLQPRQQYGLGSLVKSAVKGVTGAVKGVASGIKDFAKSDLGKAALIGAAAFGLPGTSFGGLFGRAGFGGSAMGLFGKEGIAATLGGLGIPGSGAAGEYLKTKGGKTLAIAGAGTLLGGVLSKAEQGDPEAMATVRDVGALKTYLTSGYENLGYSPEEIDTLVQKDLSEYKSIGGYAYGGRVQYGEGSPFKFSREPEPKTDLMKAAEKMAEEKGIPINKALKMLMEKNFQQDVTYRAMGGRIGFEGGGINIGIGTFYPERVKEILSNAGESIKSNPELIPSPYLNMSQLEKLKDIKGGVADVYKNMKDDQSGIVQGFKDETRKYKLFFSLPSEDKKKMRELGMEMLDVEEYLDMKNSKVGKKDGGRMGFMMGSEVPLRQNQAGVNEMDYRNTGGFVPPIGVKERADDIPAMLSNNEFVFTADAVRAAGGGSVNKGAQKMYALMKQLEGKVV